MPIAGKILLRISAIAFVAFFLRNSFASQSGTGAYDYQEAFRAAGRQLPADRNEYYMFDIPADAPIESTANELGALMIRASTEHDYLGVVGPDAALNRSIFFQALAKAKGHPLSGLIIIYLGEAGSEPELRGRAESAGAGFRFSVYP